MVILTKIRSATLLETLVASVLIVIVFMIASLTFTNTVGTSIKKDKRAIKNRVNELVYKSIHEQLEASYFENFNAYEIEIIRMDEHIEVSYQKDSEVYHQRIPIYE